MSNPFYDAITRTPKESTALQISVDDGLLPFKHYLQNSINAFKDKEVVCRWQKVNQLSYTLKPCQNIYKATPLTQLKISSSDENWYQLDNNDLDNDFEIDLTDDVIVGQGKNRQKHSLTKNDYRQLPNRHEIRLDIDKTVERISWLGYQIHIKPICNTPEKYTQISVNGELYEVESILDDVLTIKGILPASLQKISVDGQELLASILDQCSREYLPTKSTKTDGSGFIYSKNQPASHPLCLIANVTEQELASLLLENLQADGKALNSSQWRISRHSTKLTLEALTQDAPEFEHIVFTHHSELVFQITQDDKKSDNNWIQLLEPETDDDSGRSALDYFFSENATIQDPKNPRICYVILQSKPEERQILLGLKPQRGEKKYKTRQKESLLPESTHLKAKADVVQLKKQQDAINALQKVPHQGQLGLLQLLTNRDRQRWPDLLPMQLADSDWRILTDLSFDGCLEQREFVEKALATEDFAILDGPPGTGKTTCILELIVQLVREGKRVLLTASTHAAINNVLERIDSKKLDNEIFPLRIGDKGNAQNVAHYQSDELLDRFKQNVSSQISSQLLVDSANLVCGTTIGIMRLFSDREITLPMYEPAFDVMIIDECSKTPFQEFLVPARYAAKHVLVGDIRQLSPFTDREQIVANLENLLLKKGRRNEPDQTLSKELQQACFLLEELRGNRDNLYNNQIIKVVSQHVALELQKELKERCHQFEETQKILVICHQDLSQLKQNPLPLWTHNICFISQSCISALANNLPPDAILLEDNWQQIPHSFNHCKFYSDRQVYQDRREVLQGSEAIKTHITQRLEQQSWASEVCWRLERLYWLRLANSFDKKTRAYKQAIERLLPKTIDCEGRVFNLQNIAFPSILEALSGAGLQKRKQDNPHTLNQGFEEHEKSQRCTTLSYQHRMHPDISAYPGKQFYQGKSLKNGSHLEAHHHGHQSSRHWDYRRYTSHSIWLDVSSSSKQARVNKNQNFAEVKAIVTELQIFCQWAKGRKNDEGKAYSVAILTFYKGQENALRQALKELSGNKSGYASFEYQSIPIKLATVDYFQGQEADLVFLSMVNNHRDGFLDSPNRLNVAITRARYQLVIAGCYEYFHDKSRTDELRFLARSIPVFKEM